MARNVCRIAGLALLVFGLAGFALPTMLGLHLTTIHNVVHLLTGLVALYVGFATTFAAARGFCLVFGGGYLLLGLAGLVAPGVVASMLGHPPVSAGDLAPDNTLHAVLGAALLVVGWKARRKDLDAEGAKGAG